MGEPNVFAVVPELPEEIDHYNGRRFIAWRVRDRARAEYRTLMTLMTTNPYCAMY
jgi:hypothetical protein